MNRLIVLRVLVPFLFLTLFCRAQEGHPAPPQVPDLIIFAGDTIRFDRQDYYEKMDRELISFTYMHTNSTLMLKRAPRIFAIVEPILKREGLPLDLKYLMAIESNLEPKALSGAGAAGLWQMMKSTAKEYGLEVTTEVDERYNIEKETVAACKYLKEAYAKYGDWMTVAASYNGGQNGISRRLESQKEDSALNLWLVEETSRYMYRILAAKMLFENPSAFGFNDVKPYPLMQEGKKVKVSTPIESLVDFAHENGVSYATLKGANLWLRDSCLTNKAGKTYEILIPPANR